MVIPILLTVLLGNQITDIIPTIAKLRIKSFKGYPYLYNGTLESELEYLELYKNNEHALVVQESESAETVMLIGAPLIDIFPEAKTIFESAQYNADECYYAEEVVLPLANMPLILEAFEAQVIKWNYKNLCLITVKEEENHPLKPENYQSIEPLFEELGFSKTDLSISAAYSTFCAGGSVQQRGHEFVFWIKKLN